VAVLIRQPTFAETIGKLKSQVGHSPDRFVWSVIDLNSIHGALPEDIKSGWIFVLKKDTPSGCHYHPNSVQHMVMIEGQGESEVGGLRKRMICRGDLNQAMIDAWHVIPEGVPHEFFPEKKDMVVVSFHTCKAYELEEIDCQTSEKRLYEG